MLATGVIKSKATKSEHIVVRAHVGIKRGAVVCVEHWGVHILVDFGRHVERIGGQRTAVVGSLLRQSAANIGVVSVAASNDDWAARGRVSNDGSHPWFVLASQSSFPAVPV